MKWIGITALLLAILFGVAVAYAHQISFLVFVPNVVAFIFGSILILFGVQTYDYIQNRITYFSAGILTILGLTLCFQGFENVRRWIYLGPVQLNVSLALTPILLFALTQLNVRESILTSVIASVIYFFQPDASQSLAFAVAANIIFMNRKDLSVFEKMFASVLLLALAVATWFQKDSLPAVPHVEDILRIAFSLGPLFMIGSIVAAGFLFFPMLSIFIKSRLAQKRIFVGSLIAFWGMNFLCTELGRYPVPVIGAGAAGVIGFSISYILIFGFEPTDSASNISSSI